MANHWLGMGGPVADFPIQFVTVHRGFRAERVIHERMDAAHHL
jgi:hypothetical protein